MNKWIVSIGVILFSLCMTLQGVEERRFAEPVKPMAFDQKKTYLATIYTSKGEIVCELYPDKAPLSVTNFIQLAEGGYYDGLSFHSVIRNFVIQSGDPEGTGNGGPGYTLPPEIGLKHHKGALGWAHPLGYQNLDGRSSGSQFYITEEEMPHLDKDFTVFGQTIKGQDVVERIELGDVIKKIEITISK